MNSKYMLPPVVHLHRNILPLHVPYVSVHKYILLIFIFHSLNMISDLFKDLYPFIPSFYDLSLQLIHPSRIPRQIASAGTMRHPILNHSGIPLFPFQFQKFLIQSFQLPLGPLVSPEILLFLFILFLQVYCPSPPHLPERPPSIALTVSARE